MSSGPPPSAECGHVLASERTRTGRHTHSGKPQRSIKKKISNESMKLRRPRRRERQLKNLCERGEHKIRKPVNGLGAERSEEHTSELQSPYDLVCRLLLEKKKTKKP